MESMIHPDKLRRALDVAPPVWRRLQARYALLAETDCACSRPGICCRFLPEMTFAEALQWVDVLRSQPPPRRADTLRRFVEFYATCPLHRDGCPFLEAGRCSVYTQRPFACRAYGLWSMETGRRRTADNRASRELLARQWRRFGVELPAEAIRAEMDYCADVRHRPTGTAGDAALMDILAGIYELDRAFAPLGDLFENHYHSDFSFLLAGMLLGDRKAVLGKFAVVKDLVRQKPTGRLEALLSQARPERLFGEPRA